MDEQQKQTEELNVSDAVAADKVQTERDQAILELVKLADEEQKQTDGHTEKNTVDTDEQSDTSVKKERLFQKYKIKDIVFLAIITACTLVTGAVMPFVSGIPLFGIIQLCLGLQFSVLPVIGLMKVRKPGALVLQSVFISIFLAFMFTPMVCIIVCALIAECVGLLIFRSYKNDWACVVAGTLYMPLTLPMLILLYNTIPSIGKGKAAESMFLLGSANAGVAIGISIAIVALCFVGSVVGMIIARELKKSGKLK